jgi:1,4-alpha-glucan branching enzyme
MITQAADQPSQLTWLRPTNSAQWMKEDGCHTETATVSQHRCEPIDVDSVRFRVWAPYAKSVAIQLIEKEPVRHFRT